MTGNGKHTTYFQGDDWGMVYYYFTHISTRLTINIKKNKHFLWLVPWLVLE